MAQLTVNVRMEENLKKQLEEILAKMGMNMTTAFNVFARAIVQREEIPFIISAREDIEYERSNRNATNAKEVFFNKLEKNIIEALKEMERDEGIPAEEAFQELERRLNL